MRTLPAKLESNPVDPGTDKTGNEKVDSGIRFRTETQGGDGETWTGASRIPQPDKP